MGSRQTRALTQDDYNAVIEVVNSVRSKSPSEHNSWTINTFNDNSEGVRVGPQVHPAFTDDFAALVKLKKSNSTALSVSLTSFSEVEWRKLISLGFRDDEDGVEPVESIDMEFWGVVIFVLVMLGFIWYCRAASLRRKQQR